jgi:hypothetical protein
MPVPRRRLVLTAVLLGTLLAGGAVTLDRLAGDEQSGPGGPGAAGRPGLADRTTGSADRLAPPTLTLPGELFLRHPPVTRAGPAQRRGPVLSLPGEFPTDGPGSFIFASEPGAVLGGSGPLRRFRVGIEHGVAEDPARFAGFVDDTLGAEPGWTAGGEVRFQRMPEGARHDFTIYLATSATAARMCERGGLDVVGFGLPDGGVSCQTPGQVILNLSRWRQSAPPYLEREVPLEIYRRMLVNHEVGHQLGHQHQPCPGPGELAPVMQQQTLDLAGCLANPWPHPDRVSR